jgi:predicted DNA-binding WGR domain protein
MTKVDVSSGRYGKNVFYEMQVIREKVQDNYYLFTRWGRIGDRWSCQDQTTPFPTEAEATEEFTKIFRSKTGNAWEERSGFEQKPKKYQYQPRSAEVAPEDALDLSKWGINAQPSVLPVALQRLLSVASCKSLVDVILTNNQMSPETIPLGRLSALTSVIDEVRSLLHQIEHAIRIGNEEREKSIPDGVLLQANADLVARLSSRHYELIPHVNFSHTNVGPMDIRALEKERVTVEMLAEVCAPVKCLLGAESRLTEMNPIDYLYAAMRTDLAELERGSSELALIQDYINRSSPGSCALFRKEGSPPLNPSVPVQVMEDTNLFATAAGTVVSGELKAGDRTCHAKLGTPTIGEDGRSYIPIFARESSSVGEPFGWLAELTSAGQPLLRELGSHQATGTVSMYATEAQANARAITKAAEAAGPQRLQLDPGTIVTTTKLAVDSEGGFLWHVRSGGQSGWVAELNADGNPNFSYIEPALLGSKVAAIHRVGTPDEHPNTETMLAVGNCQLLFHGSQMANLVSMLSGGLKIKPRGVYHSGSALGNGIYFANAFEKSKAYSGQFGNTGYMLLCEVAMGRPLELSEEVYGTGLTDAAELVRKAVALVQTTPGSSLRHAKLAIAAADGDTSKAASFMADPDQRPGLSAEFRRADEMTNEPEEHVSLSAELVLRADAPIKGTGCQSVHAKARTGPSDAGTIVHPDGYKIPAGPVVARPFGTSSFGMDEIVVYSERQVKVRYLIELREYNL